MPAQTIWDVILWVHEIFKSKSIILSDSVMVWYLLIGLVCTHTHRPGTWGVGGEWRDKWFEIKCFISEIPHLATQPNVLLMVTHSYNICDIHSSSQTLIITGECLFQILQLNFGFSYLCILFWMIFFILFYDLFISSKASFSQKEKKVSLFYLTLIRCSCPLAFLTKFSQSIFIFLPRLK